MEISAGEAVASAVQAKSNVANAKVGEVLSPVSLSDAEKTAGNAVVDLLAATRLPGSPGQLLDIRV
jgi:hypothetical protein